MQTFAGASAVDGIKWQMSQLSGMKICKLFIQTCFLCKTKPFNQLTVN